MNRKGFTLIELLVVIAIIAILAAILFPVFAKAREKARQISCTSNEKQIGLGILQYVQDNDETYPSGVGLPGVANGRGWTVGVYPYVKSIAVFSCPDDSTPAPAVSYAMNGNFDYDNYLPPTYSGTAEVTTIASLGASSSTILAFEIGELPCDPSANPPIGSEKWAPTGNGGGVPYEAGGTLNAGDNGTPGLPYDGVYATGVMSSIPIPSTFDKPYSGYVYQAVTGRHTDGSNFLYADGHVKYARPGSISAGPNNSGAPGDCGRTNGTEAARTDCSQFVGTFSIK